MLFNRKNTEKERIIFLAKEVLSPIDFEILYSYLIKGRTYKQIAKELNLKVSTVKKRRKRIETALKGPSMEETALPDESIIFFAKEVLSPFDFEILHGYIIKGLTLTDIAEELDMQPRTVQIRWDGILEKLNKCCKKYGLHPEDFKINNRQCQDFDTYIDPSHLKDL